MQATRIRILRRRILGRLMKAIGGVADMIHLLSGYVNNTSLDEYTTDDAIMARH